MGLQCHASCSACCASPRLHLVGESPRGAPQYHAAIVPYTCDGRAWPGALMDTDQPQPRQCPKQQHESCKHGGAHGFSGRPNPTIHAYGPLSHPCARGRHRRRYLAAASTAGAHPALPTLYHHSSSNPYFGTRHYASHRCPFLIYPALPNVPCSGIHMRPHPSSPVRSSMRLADGVPQQGARLGANLEHAAHCQVLSSAANWQPSHTAGDRWEPTV